MVELAFVITDDLSLEAAFLTIPDITNRMEMGGDGCKRFIYSDCYRVTESRRERMSDPFPCFTKKDMGERNGPKRSRISQNGRFFGFRIRETAGHEEKMEAEWERADRQDQRQLGTIGNHTPMDSPQQNDDDEQQPGFLAPGIRTHDPRSRRCLSFILPPFLSIQ